MRNRNTLEFIGLREVLNNPNFNRAQFDTFRNRKYLNILSKYGGVIIPDYSLYRDSHYLCKYGIYLGVEP